MQGVNNRPAPFCFVLEHNQLLNSSFYASIMCSPLALSSGYQGYRDSSANVALYYMMYRCVKQVDYESYP